jgi:DNA-binding NtrC family response regulator
MPRGIFRQRERGVSRSLRLPDTSSEPIRKLVKIVIFEDTDFLLDLFFDNLKVLKGFDIVSPKTTCSTAEALRTFEKEKPDIVITDLCLTSDHTEGFDILAAIKKVSPDTVVVLSTSIYSDKGTDDLSCEIRRKGFDAVFHKLDFEHLTGFLQQTIREHH